MFFSPGDAQTVAFYAGPLMVVAYLVGSVPVRYLLERQQLRAAMQEPDPFVSRAPAADIFSTTGLVHGVGAILVSEFARWAMKEVAPGVSAARIEAAVAAFSNQVLTAWQSVAIWAGAAFVLGVVAPIWTGLRGGATGFAPALALGFWHAPIPTSSAALAYIGLLAVSERDGDSLLGGLFVGSAVAWAGWVFDWKNYIWGLDHGPEIALWVVVLGGVVAARNYGPAVDSDPPPGM